MKPESRARMRTDRPTKLAHFMYDNDITLQELASRSGYSRSHIGHFRVGRTDPKLMTMLNIAQAASYILGRRVEVAELFDITIRLDEQRMRGAS